MLHGTARVPSYWTVAQSPFSAFFSRMVQRAALVSSICSVIAHTSVRPGYADRWRNSGVRWLATALERAHTSGPIETAGGPEPFSPVKPGHPMEYGQRRTANGYIIILPGVPSGTFTRWHGKMRRMATRAIHGRLNTECAYAIQAYRERVASFGCRVRP